MQNIEEVDDHKYSQQVIDSRIFDCTSSIRINDSNIINDNSRIDQNENYKSDRDSELMINISQKKLKLENKSKDSSCNEELICSSENREPLSEGYGMNAIANDIRISNKLKINNYDNSNTYDRQIRDQSEGVK